MSPSKIKKQFAAEGLTVSSWARAYGFPPHAVRRVLSGTYACRWGQAHQIAIALGLKPKVEPQLNRSASLHGDRRTKK